VIPRQVVDAEEAAERRVAAECRRVALTVLARGGTGSNTRAHSTRSLRAIRTLRLRGLYVLRPGA